MKDEKNDIKLNDTMTNDFVKKDSIPVRYLIYQRPANAMRESIRVGDYEIVPVYFQWDDRDRKILKYVADEKERTEQTGGPNKNRTRLKKILRKQFQKLAIAYFHKRYREVFLENTETLFLSEKAQEEIPSFLWTAENRETGELHWSYARETFGEIMNRVRAERKTDGEKVFQNSITLVLALQKEARLAVFEEWLEEIREEPLVLSVMADIILIGSSQQKEGGEELLDSFYEQTGIAGSFYDSIKQYRREMAERVYTDNSVKRNILFLDCLGVPVKEIGRVAFYIDGAGVKTKGEIHKAQSVGISCKSLRKYLDSTFLSKL